MKSVIKTYILCRCSHLESTSRRFWPHSYSIKYMDEHTERRRREDRGERKIWDVESKFHKIPVSVYHISRQSIVSMTPVGSLKHKAICKQVLASENPWISDSWNWQIMQFSFMTTPVWTLYQGEIVLCSKSWWSSSAVPHYCATTCAIPSLCLTVL